MCDDDIHQGIAHEPGLSRRDFALTSGTAALVLAAGSAAAADVVERDVDIRTPDGTADAALFHPSAGGQAPGGPDLDRHPRPAPGVPADGPPARRSGLRRAGAQPVLPRAARADRRRRLRLHQARGPRQGDAARRRADAGGRRRRCEGLRRLPRRAAADGHGQEGRRAGLLHGGSRSPSAPPPPAPTASAPPRPSTAAAWSRTSRRAPPC